MAFLTQMLHRDFSLQLCNEIMQLCFHDVPCLGRGDTSSMLPQIVKLNMEQQWSSNKHKHFGRGVRDKQKLSLGERNGTHPWDELGLIPRTSRPFSVSFHSKLGVPKPGCLKFVCNFYAEALFCALLHTFALLILQTCVCALLRSFALFCVHLRICAGGVFGPAASSRPPPGQRLHVGKVA